MATDPATQGPFVIVNADDFDPAVHQLYAEPAPQDAGEQPQPRQADEQAAGPRRRGRPSAT